MKKPKVLTVVGTRSGRLSADEELEILRAWDAGLLKPVSNMVQEITAHRAVAEATFKKDQRLNIRISSRDLKSLQARALEEGTKPRCQRLFAVHCG